MAAVGLAYLLACLTLFPFFEGCESATGLFLLHLLTLGSLAFCILRSPRMWLPPLSWFLPFLFYLIFSAFVISPYRYSGLLELWDWWIAAFMAVVFTTVMKENENGLQKFAFYAFLTGTASLLISILLAGHLTSPRWRGTFANPNDFAAYCALLLLPGIYVLEKTASRSARNLVWVALTILAVCVAMASSRSVFLGCAPVLLLYVWQRKPASWVTWSISGFVALSAAILSIRVFQYHDPFKYYRLRIWKYSLLGILKDPYFGIGLNMLPWKASRFIFPADMELGRYGMIATSADNQYLQILAETGFLGFFLFLMGWVAMFQVLRRIPERFTILRYSAFIMISIVAVFSLPLQNTAVLGLFLLLILFPVVASEEHLRGIQLSRPARIAGVLLLGALGAVAVLVPYAADFEYRSALTSSTAVEVQERLKRASDLNPMQPYYLFARVKPLIQAQPNLTEAQWESVLRVLERCSALNPLDSDFYMFRARVYGILWRKTGSKEYFARAMEEYGRTMEQSPYQVFQRIDRAFFLLSAGMTDAAEQDLHDILALEPVYLNARLLLVDVLVAKGNLKDARREYATLEEYMQKYRAQMANPPTAYIRRLLDLNTTRKDELAALIR